VEGGLGEKVYRLLETRPRVLVNSLLESRAKWKEKCGVSKVELQAFRGKVRDQEISREKWRISSEENETLRRDLAQQLELAQAQNKQLEERLAASEAEEKTRCRSSKVRMFPVSIIRLNKSVLSFRN